MLGRFGLCWPFSGPPTGCSEFPDTTGGWLSRHPPTSTKKVRGYPPPVPMSHMLSWHSLSRHDLHQVQDCAIKRYLCSWLPKKTVQQVETTLSDCMTEKSKWCHRKEFELPRLLLLSTTLLRVILQPARRRQQQGKRATSSTRTSSLTNTRNKELSTSWPQTSRTTFVLRTPFNRHRWMDRWTGPPMDTVER